MASCLSFRNALSWEDKFAMDVWYTKNVSFLGDVKILIDTVARIQGLTTDICVYVVPNTHYLRALEPRLFNVATSRARRQTIIIADKEILKCFDNERNLWFTFNLNEIIYYTLEKVGEENV